jgi:hypothetical protein
MPTFHVVTIERIDRSATYRVKITKDEVISFLSLNEDEAKKWHDHVAEYVSQYWSSLEARPSTINDDITEDSMEFDIESVELEAEEV